MADKAFNTYLADETPASSWTIVAWPRGTENLQQPTLDAVFTAMLGSGYANSLSLTAALGGAYHAVAVAGVSSPLQLNTAGAKVVGTLLVGLGGQFSVTSTGNVLCQTINAVSIIAGAVVVMQLLPTADPHNAGQLWNNAGVLNVSAG